MNNLYESKVLARKILMDLCSSNRFVTKVQLKDTLRLQTEVDPIYYQIAVDSAFNVFKDEQLVSLCEEKETAGSCMASERVWQSQIYNKRDYFSL